MEVDVWQCLKVWKRNEKSVDEFWENRYYGVVLTARGGMIHWKAWKYMKCSRKEKVFVFSKVLNDIKQFSKEKSHCGIRHGS